MRSNNPVSLKALGQFQTVDELSGFAKAQYNIESILNSQL